MAHLTWRDPDGSRRHGAGIAGRQLPVFVTLEEIAREAPAITGSSSTSGRIRRHPELISGAASGYRCCRHPRRAVLGQRERDVRTARPSRPG